MKFHTSFHTKQAGDTIVEVIIAVAVISTVLAGAFLVTTNSSRGIRDSEEHAQALQYLQGQVELLRSAASDSGGLPTTLTSPFCLDTANYYQPATTNSHCILGARYKVSITSPTSSPTTNATTTFNLVATWPSVSGGMGTVYLAYKVPVTP
jgi:type II secretory pathway pseudopilin PulG